MRKIVALSLLLMGSTGCDRLPCAPSAEFSEVTIVVRGKFRCENGRVYQWTGSSWNILLHPQADKYEVPCP